MYSQSSTFTWQVSIKTVNCVSASSKAVPKNQMHLKKFSVLNCVSFDVQQMDIYSNPLLQKSTEEPFPHSKTSHALFSSYKTSFVKVQTQCWCRIQWRITIVKMSCSKATGPRVPCYRVWLLPLPLGMGKLLTDTFTTEELSKINPLKLLAYRTLHTAGFLNLCQCHHLAEIFKYIWVNIIKLCIMELMFLLFFLVLFIFAGHTKFYSEGKVARRKTI